MVTKDIEYDADGTIMVSHLAIPDGVRKRPAVLIAHEGPGLDDYQRSRADQMAELGYVACALDYHGGGRWFSDRDAMFARLGALAAEPLRRRAIARAALDALLAEPRVDASRIAAIGYCFGGDLVLELARDGADLKAVVGFHPGLTSVPGGGHWSPEENPTFVAEQLIDFLR